MAQSITLQQFETIDGLFNAFLRRPDLDDDLMQLGGDYVREVYFLPEWKLFDACIDAIGYDAANAFPSTIDCAANILTDCYIGMCDVVDALVEA